MAGRWDSNHLGNEFTAPKKVFGGTRQFHAKFTSGQCPRCNEIIQEGQVIVHLASDLNHSVCPCNVPEDNPLA